MEAEFYDVHYIGFDKVIISGQTSDSKAVEVELDKEQKNLLADYLYKEDEMKRRFIRTLINGY